MPSNDFYERERKHYEKMRNWQLPDYFKKIGITIAIISFITLFLNAFSFELSWLKISSKYGILAGLLIISISKEKIEDELVTKLRMQSYTFAFLMAVLFSLFQPFLNFSVDWIGNAETAVFKDNGDFMILWMLLFVQVFYFEMLKRMYK